MRKMLAGMAIGAALAWTQGTQANDAKTAQEKPSGHAQQPGGQSAGTAPGRETTVGGPDRTSREMRADARADANPANRHGEFEGKKNFDVDGKVSHASAGEITIERKGGLPPATLKLGSGTKVEVNGKHASAAQLQPGQDVKASFNLRGGTAEAVEVKAGKPKQDDRKDLQEQRRENQQERAKDTQRQQH
jgi:hypothetical protein